MIQIPLSLSKNINYLFIWLTLRWRQILKIESLDNLVFFWNALDLILLQEFRSLCMKSVSLSTKCCTDVYFNSKELCILLITCADPEFFFQGVGGGGSDSYLSLRGGGEAKVYFWHILTPRPPPPQICACIISFKFKAFKAGWIPYHIYIYWDKWKCSYS